MKSTISMTAGLAAALAFAGVAAAQEATELTVQTSQQHGEYIADGEGRALYMFEPDTQGEGDTKAESTCYDACAEAWPPLMGENAQAGDQVQADLIGSFERRGGEMQITYNGWPLYYFVQDQGPGQTTGQDVEGFGGEWYLLKPSGEIVGH